MPSYFSYPRSLRFWPICISSSFMGSSCLALRGRDVWFACTIGALVIAASRSAALTGGRHVLYKVDILIIIASVCSVLFPTARAAHISEGDLQIAVARTYPVEAANGIEKRGYPG